MASTTTETLVCPDCGGDRLGTVERAFIWQPASFVLDAEGVVERADGQRVDIDWDAYDSDDVGDTETVGWVCKDCLFEHNAGDEAGPIPFVTRAEFEAANRG